VISVVEAERADADLVAAFARLVPQVSRSSPPTEDELVEMVAAPGTRVLLAVDSEREGSGEAVVGSLTLVVFRIPTGVRAWIEDVVVDEGARRRGVASALMARALEVAGDAGARTVDLTSRPTREAANQLYAKLGFERRDTNVWRVTLA
jgi:ribosomal protein S18 acetylase RimI-like enzyme